MRREYDHSTLQSKGLVVPYRGFYVTLPVFETGNA
jgi:hypothetical protein